MTASADIRGTTSPASSPPALTDVLRDLFGFPAFRAHQEPVIRALLAARDAFVVMPTGGGKSLCYQLPAHLLEGTCVVVSPLISLMKDQVDAATATGLRAAYLNSALWPWEQNEVSHHLLRGGLDLLYVSPERLAMPQFLATLARIRLSFFAVDEAHCISEWGHDFRPDYLGLATLTERFPGTPIAAFTATATPRVQEDIIDKLRLRSPLLVRASFNRPNLFYRIRPKVNPAKQILSFVRKHAGQAGIIYRTTRRSVEETATQLRDHGVRAVAYHAGLEDRERAANQEAFNRDEVDVVVATIAFGMGIDKSNVRYVLHADLPRSLEGYYQETGRAGRDGEPAECFLLLGFGDIPKLRYFNEQIPEEAERKHANRCLAAMVSFATVYACRRKQLLSYFDEVYSPPSCGACDVCAGEVESVDATRDAQIVMSAIVRTGQRFGMGHVIDVVAGASTERIHALGHDRIKTYGIGADRPRHHWRLVLDHLIAQGLVAQSGKEYPTLSVRPTARDVLGGAVPFFVSISRDRVPARQSTPSPGAPIAAGAQDADLFEVLRGLRRRLAGELGVPPYVVFSDRTLREMAALRPACDAELLGVTGVGQRKLEQFGMAFLEAIAAFVAGRRTAPPALPPPASGGR
ncbi:MAG: DNA helicase RecQ [Candidatus Schekmanbacteria bacterium]|nr:DNA helicase RecQ [Candidatus Schekmanbacteria bacterium]